MSTKRSVSCTDRVQDHEQDLGEQARAGHGVPSQDPDPAAQFPLTPGEAQRESESALVGGGLVGGMAAGAAAGGVVAGPVGIVVGASLGAVAGALGGAAVGAAMGVGVVDSSSDEGVNSLVRDPVRLHIEDSGGGGRPLVLIHGWPLSSEAWEPQVDALVSAGYRVVRYDRRGFGRSDKPRTGYDYDSLADDLHHVISTCRLSDASLIGFSMGGGEVARYVARFGPDRLRSVVFAASITPYLLQCADNPKGPLTPEKAEQKHRSLEHDRSAYFEQFSWDFYSCSGALQVTALQRAQALMLCHQSAPHAALACMKAFSSTDFRDDLLQLKLPTLVMHGDTDAVVPMESSALLTHWAVPHSRLVIVKGAPHGFNVSHVKEFNASLLEFLRG